VGDASPSVPLHQVCLVLSIAPSLYSVLLSHCTRSVTVTLSVTDFYVPKILSMMKGLDD
jgi:hypothetical protein